MRLTFPNGEHAAVDLKDGLTKVGSGPGLGLTLLSPSVSAHHCDIELTQGVARIKVTHPTHIVTVNNLRVASSIEFKNGDQLLLGEVKVRVAGEEKPAFSFAPAGAPATAPITAPSAAPAARREQEDDGRTKVRQALPKFMLRGVSGITFGKVFPLHGTTVIGRQEGCDIHINSDEISRRHAELRPTPDGVMVEDLGSANGTWINDRRINREMLKAGDELRFDTIRFQLVAPGREAPAATGPAASPAAKTSAPTAPAATSGGMPPVVWVAISVAALALVALVLKLSGVF